LRFFSAALSGLAAFGAAFGAVFGFGTVAIVVSLAGLDPSG
jgi:hypothetical protein